MYCAPKENKNKFKCYLSNSNLSKHCQFLLTMFQKKFSMRKKIRGERWREMTKQSESSSRFLVKKEIYALTQKIDQDRYSVQGGFGLISRCNDSLRFWYSDEFQDWV